MKFFVLLFYFFLPLSPLSVSSIFGLYWQIDHATLDGITDNIVCIHDNTVHKLQLNCCLELALVQPLKKIRCRKNSMITNRNFCADWSSIKSMRR